MLKEKTDHTIKRELIKKIVVYSRELRELAKKHNIDLSKIAIVTKWRS
jgi:hypothetical protein